MARPVKATVLYFLHTTAPGRTISALEHRFQNDGYAVLFKTFELLGATENHFLDCNQVETWEYALSRYNVQESTAIEILDLLARLDTIDADLWGKKVIWSANFVQNLAGVYSRREIEPYNKSQIMSYCIQKPQVSGVNVNKKPFEYNSNPTTVLNSTLQNSIFAQFADFWEIYPKKLDKSKAKEKWTSLKITHEVFGQIRAHLEYWKNNEEWQKESGKYIPYPSTYLNKKRWEDGIPKTGSVSPVEVIKSLYPTVDELQFSEDFDRKETSDND